MLIDLNYMSTPGSDVGSRSSRIWADQQQQHNSGPLLEEAMEAFTEKLCLGYSKARFLRQE